MVELDALRSDRPGTSEEYLDVYHWLYEELIEDTVQNPGPFLVFTNSTHLANKARRGAPPHVPITANHRALPHRTHLKAARPRRCERRHLTYTHMDATQVQGLDPGSSRRRGRRRHQLHDALERERRPDPREGCLEDRRLSAARVDDLPHHSFPRVCLPVHKTLLLFPQTAGRG